MSSSTRPFRIGQAVTMVDRRTGEPVEVVRIAGIGGGEVAVEGYTARFRASDGTGLDTEQVRLVRSAQVIDMAGNTLVPSGDVRVPVRVIAARHDIRPATAADRRATAERREFETLAAELAKHLADASVGRADVQPSQLLAVARALGHQRKADPKALARSA